MKGDIDEVLGRDGLMVCCEQALCTIETIEALFDEWKLGKKAIKDWHTQVDFLGITGAADDPNSIYGDANGRMAVIEERLLTYSVNLSANLQYEETEMEGVVAIPRAAWEVAAELHEAAFALDRDGLTDRCVLAGPAGSPFQVARSDWEEVCEPVTAETFLKHAWLFADEHDLGEPELSGDWLSFLDFRIKNSINSALKELNKRMDTPPWFEAPFQAAVAVADNQPLSDPALAAQWPLLVEIYMERMAAYAWYSAVNVHPNAEEYVAEPNLLDSMNGLARMARAHCLKERWIPMSGDPEIPLKQRAQIVMAAQIEVDAAWRAKTDSVVLTWFGQEFEDDD